MIDCIKTAYEEANESRLFLLYCSAYTMMTSETFKTFDDFIGKKKEETQQTKQQKKGKTVEEILKDVELITKARR